MADTNIEWTNKVWNPTLGCVRVSTGCGGADVGGCYAERLAFRLAAMGRPEYQGLTHRLPNGVVRWTGKVICLPERLKQPLRWQKPARIFVDSMSDLFHKDVPNEFIAAVFGVMAWADTQTFQVLTKRPDRMRDFVERLDPIQMRRALWDLLKPTLPMPEWVLYVDGKPPAWPLRNVWLGTSVEDQRAADERIPLLLQTPAAVRFLSCEPLLGPIQLGVGDEFFDYGLGRDNPNEPRIHWVIAGGESGPNYRPMDIDWARSLRDQCQAAGVAFHFKQIGGRTHAARGRLLDGRTWDEFPEPARESAPA